MVYDKSFFYNNPDGKIKIKNRFLRNLSGFRAESLSAFFDLLAVFLCVKVKKIRQVLICPKNLLDCDFRRKRTAQPGGNHMNIHGKRNHTWKL